MIYIILFLGLCFGSFVNALVWRTHQNSKTKKAKLSIVNGRSVCPNCKHSLGALDLVPVLSWLSLKGKCRYCHKPISRQYPLVELLTAILFVASYAYWPYSLVHSTGLTLFVFWLVFLTGFMALAIYDLKWLILPDKIVYKLIGLATAQVAIYLVLVPDFKQLTSVLAGVLVGGGLFWLIFQVSNGRWIGGGDVKLGFLIGLILMDGGLAALTIFAASIIGTLIAVPLMITGKATKTSRIPFGPLLIAGAIVARLFGLDIIHWYTHALLMR